MRALLAFVLGAAAAAAAAEPPRRIVSTSPSLTETLFALGLGDRVVGVSTYCRHPPAVAVLPKVGTFLKPDAEAIARLTPDLVVVHDSPHGIESRLAALRLRFVSVRQGGLANIYTTIRAIGDAAGVPDRAAALVSDIAARLARTRETAARGKRPRVLLIVGRRPGTLSDIVAVGRGPYLDELLEIAGGTNALAGAGLSNYPRLSLETVIRLRPDVILDTGDMGDSPEERRRQEQANQALWRGSALVARAGVTRILTTTTDALVVPGPRVTEAAEWLFERIHGAAAR